jgi:hypothetical protein
MPNSLDSHNSNHIGDLVDDTVITNTNSPVVFRSGEFAAAGRPRIFRERSEGNGNASLIPGGEALQVFLGRAFDENPIHPSALREIGENIL